MAEGKEQNIPKKWIIGGTIYLEIAGYQVILIGNKDSISNKLVYSGNVDFGSSPLSIKKIASRFFTSTFNIELPSSVPDLLFYSLSGSIQTEPSKEYQFNALSKIKLPNPLDLSNSSIDFDQLTLSLNYVYPPSSPSSDIEEDSNTPTTPTVAGQKYISITAQVVYNNTDGDSINFGKAMFIFKNGNYAFGLEIKQTISPAGILESLIGQTIPQGVKDFLPDFKPESETKPIRLYKAKEKLTYLEKDSSGNLNQTVFEAGFNVDQLVIQILGSYDFLVQLTINNGFSISARSQIIHFFGLFNISHKHAETTSFGPELQIQSVNSSISLHGSFIFFPNETSPIELDFDFTYLKNIKEFQGDVQYIGSVAGITNPELGFAWSEENGFRLTKFPINTNELEKALNWAEELKKLSNLSKDACAKACGEIVDMVFDQTITTKFNFKYSPQAGSQDGYVGLKVSGSYSITVLGHNIDDIVFNDMDLDFKIPKSFDDLANAILQSLKANVSNIAKGLWDNKTQLTELMTFITFKVGAKTATCRLACKVGKEALKKAFQSLIDAAAAAAAEAALGTLAEAAAAVVAAVGVLGAISRALKWLWGEISGENKRKKEAAEKKKAEAEAKIAKLLTIPSFSATYNQADGNGKNIKVTWGDVPAEKAPKNGSVNYKLTVSYPGYSKIEIINRDPKKPKDNYDYLVVKPMLKNGVNITISVQATYDVSGDHYAGPAQTTIPPISTPILQTPLPLVDYSMDTYDEKKLGTIAINWNKVTVSPPISFLQPQVNVTGYIVELWNITQNIKHQSSPTLPSASLSFTFDLYKLDEPIVNQRFIPVDSDKYQVRIYALASDSDLNSLVGLSSKFSIPWGVGNMRVGYNFKIK